MKSPSHDTWLTFASIRGHHRYHLMKNEFMKVHRYLLLVLLSMTACNAQPAKMIEKPPSHEVWDELLKTGVLKNGLVNYKAFIRQKDRLEQYLALLSNNAPNPKTWTREEQLAYWINAYNAFTIKLIADNYPVESIKDLHPVNIPFVSSVWQKKFFQIGGTKMSLDQIEHSILRKDFNEPRIHFAVNCASISCPVLRAGAYTAQEIEEQLNEQAILFINDPLRNKITTGKVEISKIFSWFKGDFTKDTSLKDFINTYSKTKIPEGSKINYLDYHWGLNDGEE